MGLRSFLDQIEPHFEKGGKLAALYPVYDATATALYTPGRTTGGASHVRDGLDLKRIMMTFWFAAWIPALVGSWVHGHNANAAMPELGMTSMEGLRGWFLNGLIGYDPASL